MQLFWFVPLNQTFLITYNSSDIPREYVGGMQPEAKQEGPSVMAQSTAGRRLLQGDLWITNALTHALSAFALSEYIDP